MISTNGRNLSLSAVTARLKATGLMMSSDPELKELLTEFILDRAVGGLARSLEEVMRVADKRIVKTQHLQLALSSISL